MLVEGRAIARIECHQRYGDGISLVFKEQRQVVRYDIA